MHIFRTLKYIYKTANDKYKNFYWGIATEVIFTIISTIMIGFLPKLYLTTVERSTNFKVYFFSATLITLTFVATFTLQSYYALINKNKIDILRNSIFTKRYLNKILHINYTILEDKVFQEKSYKAFRAISSESIGVSAVLNNTSSIIASAISTLIIIFTIISFKNRLLNITILFVVLINIILAVLNERIMYKHFEQENNILFQQEYYTKYCLDYKNNKDIKNYDIFNFIKRKYIFSFENLIKIKKEFLNKEEKMQFISSSISIFATAILYYIIIFYNKHFDGDSDILFFLNLIIVFPNIVLELFNSLKHYILGVRQTEDYLFILNLTENIISKCDEIKIKIQSIDIKNVSFMYKNATTHALKNITLNVNSGMKIAIVGENGSGKTTLIKLLLKLYNEYTGSIYLGGIDLATINKDTLYNNIGCLFQNTQSFPFTIKDNIILNNEFNEKNFEKVLDQMCLNEIIKNLNFEKDTFLNKDFISSAVDLSGGENKKILLARILYKKPLIVFLDEPAASLDIVSEKNLYENIKKCLPDSTIIFTTHHLISTTFCDKIFFMEKGKIIENGTHKELIEKKGKYYNMFKTQYSEFDKYYSGVIKDE